MSGIAEAINHGPQASGAVCPTCGKVEGEVYPPSKVMHTLKVAKAVPFMRWCDEDCRKQWNESAT